MVQWLGVCLPVQGDVGSGPGLGGSHVPRSSWARAPQLLSLRATTTEARAPRACALKQERPPQWEARILQWGVAPARRNWRKHARNNEDPTQLINK